MVRVERSKQESTVFDPIRSMSIMKIQTNWAWKTSLWQILTKGMKQSEGGGEGGTIPVIQGKVISKVLREEFSVRDRCDGSSTIKMKERGKDEELKLQMFLARNQKSRL